MTKKILFIGSMLLLLLFSACSNDYLTKLEMIDIYCEEKGFSHGHSAEFGDIHCVKSERQAFYELYELYDMNLTYKGCVRDCCDPRRC